MKKRILFYFFVFIGFFAFSQKDINIGNWLMYFGQNKVSDRLSIHSEIQYRNHTIAPVEIEQLLIRTGINYHFKKHFATFGYAYIPSYSLETDINEASGEEDRIWQQLILNHKKNNVKFEHRIRFEQRFISTKYKTRFRYRFMLSIPLKENKTFLSFYEELFLDTSPSFEFDRNRLYAAYGYILNKNTSFQIGLLNQATKAKDKFHLQFAIFFNPDFRKK